MKHPKTLLFALSCAFVLVLVGALVAFNHHKPRLLILHSYAEEGTWEHNFNLGVQRALADNRKPLAHRWHYMTFSASDHPTTEEWEASAQRARSVIERWRPDVLLAVGEEAQTYVARHYAGRSDLRVVYAMTEDPALFGYPSAPHTTGVREVLPLQPIAELLSHLRPSPLRLYAIGVQDATGEAERQQVQAFDWGPHRLLGVTLAADLPAWQQAVQAAHSADVLLVLSHGGLALRAGHSASTDPLALVQWTAQHARPLTLGVRSRFVADGGALAVSSAPDGLGQQSTALALQALPERSASVPPPQLSHDFSVAVHPPGLAVHGVQLPSIYYQAARAAQQLYLQPAPRVALP